MQTECPRRDVVNIEDDTLAASAGIQREHPGGAHVTTDIHNVGAAASLSRPNFDIDLVPAPVLAVREQ